MASHTIALMRFSRTTILRDSSKLLEVTAITITISLRRAFVLDIMRPILRPMNRLSIYVAKSQSQPRDRTMRATGNSNPRLLSGFVRNGYCSFIAMRALAARQVSEPTIRVHTYTKNVGARFKVGRLASTNRSYK